MFQLVRCSWARSCDLIRNLRHTSPSLCYWQHVEFPSTVESSKEGGEETHRVGSEISTEQKMGYTSPAEAVLWWLDSFVTSVWGLRCGAWPGSGIQCVLLLLGSSKEGNKAVFHFFWQRPLPHHTLFIPPFHLHCQLVNLCMWRYKRYKNQVTFKYIFIF